MNGFTLIEVLVALTIFAVSFAAIDVGLRTGALGEIRTTQKQEALALAKSLLNAIDSDQYGDIDGKSGKTEGGFSWQISVTPWGTATDQGTLLAGGFWIEVSVNQNGTKVTLSTLRAGPVWREQN